jgi:tetratricopeptide (TPR) repeat protein
LRLALEVDPKNSIACTRLGDLRVSQKRYSEAEQFYEQALGYDPSSLKAMQGVVAVFIRQKQEGKALQRIQEQVAKVPDSSGFYFLLGEVLVGNKKTDEAEIALEKAIALDKHNVGAYMLLGSLQGATGQLDRVANTYERAIRENPKDIRPYLALGAFEEQRDNWQHAEQLYEEVLQIQADQPIASNNLSSLLLEHGGDPNHALALAQTARRGLPNSAETADTLARAFYKLGVYESAIPMLQEAIKQAPQNATYQYHLGLVYQKTHKPLLAKASFQRALQINPKLKQADEIRRALANLNTNP